MASPNASISTNSVTTGGGSSSVESARSVTSNKKPTSRRHDPYATRVLTPDLGEHHHATTNKQPCPQEPSSVSSLPTALLHPLTTFPTVHERSSDKSSDTIATADEQQPSSLNIQLRSPTIMRTPTPNRQQQSQPPPPAQKDLSRMFLCAPSRPGVVLAVPRERVLHVPAKPADNSRLTLCPAFDVADPSGARCEAGSACGFVHADVRGAEMQVAHERVASWRSLADVPYPRHEAGLTVEVRQPPACGGGVDRVASESLLMTRALANTNNGNTRLRHCVHFVTKGICHRGSECSFAHVVDLPALPAAAASTTLPPTTSDSVPRVDDSVGGCDGSDAPPPLALDRQSNEPCEEQAVIDDDDDKHFVSLPTPNGGEVECLVRQPTDDAGHGSRGQSRASAAGGGIAPTTTTTTPLPSSGAVVTSRGRIRNPYAAVPRTVATRLPEQPSVYRTW